MPLSCPSCWNSIESGEAAFPAESAEDFARVSAAAEGDVDVDAVGADVEHVDAFAEQYGIVVFGHGDRITDR